MGFIGATEQNRNPLCDYSSVAFGATFPRKGRLTGGSNFFIHHKAKLNLWVWRKYGLLKMPSLVREGGPRSGG